MLGHHLMTAVIVGHHTFNQSAILSMNQPPMPWGGGGVSKPSKTCTHPPPTGAYQFGENGFHFDDRKA